MRRGKEDRARRRENAEALAVERSKRTPMQQLRRLDEKLGVGKGAEKERARLKEEVAFRDLSFPLLGL